MSDPHTTRKGSRDRRVWIANRHPAWIAALVAAAVFTSMMIFMGVSGRPWYEGGTLHDATVVEWRAASARNRLATAADWVPILLERHPISQGSSDGRLRDRRPLAEQLVACMDTAPTNAGEPISRVATWCWTKIWRAARARR